LALRTYLYNIVGDRPFYFNGFNSYALMVLVADSSTRGHVTRVFQQAVAVGLTVCRTWGFRDGRSMALQKSPSIYDENVFENMLTRVNTHTNVMYKDDPTIFAWELINEPQCRSEPTGNTTQAWIEEMALHVKSIDPDHLLEVRTEGYYGPSTPTRLQDNPNIYSGQLGTDFIRNHRVNGIDFASVHMYPELWLPNGTSLEVQLQFVQSWMQAYIADAEGVLGMPVVFTEFGFCSNSTSRDQFLQAVYAWGAAGLGIVQPCRGREPAL
ncbi:hypothetical protein EJB05_34857, partial [Eragrostis curvula]